MRGAREEAKDLMGTEILCRDRTKIQKEGHHATLQLLLSAKHIKHPKQLKDSSCGVTKYTVWWNLHMQAAAVTSGPTVTWRQGEERFSQSKETNLNILSIERHKANMSDSPDDSVQLTSPCLSITIIICRGTESCPSFPVSTRSELLTAFKEFWTAN